MRRMFHLSDRPDKNYIAGLSVGGGHGALMVGLACSTQYAAIGCFLAGLDVPATAPYCDEVLSGQKPKGYANIRASIKKLVNSRCRARVHQSTAAQG